MGCANSKHKSCRHCGNDPYSPVIRSHSTMSIHRQPRQHHPGDSYHVVSLTSSTMGSLRLEISNQDSKTVTINGDEDDRDKKISYGHDRSNCNCNGNDQSVMKSKEVALELIDAKTWSKMINEKVSNIVPKTPVRTPPGEPETINAWELMEGLEDTSSFVCPGEFKSSSFSVDRDSRSSPDVSNSNSLQEIGIDWPKPIWLSSDDESDSKTSTVISDFDPEIISSFRKTLEELPPDSPFHLQPMESKIEDEDSNDSSIVDIDSKMVEDFATDDKYLPTKKDRVVLYFTSLRGIRKTYEDCCNVRLILKTIGVHVDERDVSMDSGFREELRELLGDGYSKGGLPRVFVGKKYMGGAEEIRQLHEEGRLEKLLEGCQKVEDGGSCEACGDVRFVPCETCSGSTKIYYDRDEYEEEEEECQESEFGFQRCPDCNENGLIRCCFCCD